VYETVQSDETKSAVELLNRPWMPVCVPVVVNVPPTLTLPVVPTVATALTAKLPSGFGATMHDNCTTSPFTDDPSSSV
jgi:hypothetical protein